MNTHLRKQSKEKTDCQINKKQLGRILCIFMANHFSTSFCLFDLRSIARSKNRQNLFWRSLEASSFREIRKLLLISLNNIFVHVIRERP